MKSVEYLGLYRPKKHSTIARTAVVIAALAMALLPFAPSSLSFAASTVTPDNGSTAGGNSVEIPGGAASKYIQIETGGSNAVALTSGGQVYTWGNGADTPTEVTTDGTPMAGKFITQIAASGTNAYYALASDGTVYAWGSNSSGQLGDGTTIDSLLPVAVTTTGTPMVGKTFVYSSAGNAASFVVASDGTAYVWGSNNSGDFGDGSTVDSSVPVAINLPANRTATSVRLGDVLATNLETTTDGTISFVAPAHAAGTVAMTISYNDGPDLILPAAYTYEAPASSGGTTNTTHKREVTVPDTGIAPHTSYGVTLLAIAVAIVAGAVNRPRVAQHHR